MSKKKSGWDWRRVWPYSVPVIVAIAVRVVGAVWLFQLLTTQGKIHTSWSDIYPNLIPDYANWLWLFNGWDSFNFGRIAEFGYQHPNYSYLPAYPSISYLLGVPFGTVWMGSFIAAQIFALASVVMFQLVSELYMEPKAAYHCTLLMATFPFISVFTTLGYSEGLFLFSTLSAWYFYKKQQLIASSLFAGVASVTRIAGILILLPVSIDLLKTRAWRSFLQYLIIPIGLLGSWAYYCLVTTRDSFASISDEGAWMVWATGGPGIKYGLIPSIVIPGLRGMVICCAGGNSFDSAVIVAVALFAALIIRVWKVDRLLWSYAIALFGLMLVTAPIISLLRYLSFIFPIWLTIKSTNRWTSAACVAVFVPFTLLLWYYALLRNFIG